jgi:hypothetical protein
MNAEFIKAALQVQLGIFDECCSRDVISYNWRQYVTNVV